jgi:hypothetical protein
LAIHPSEPEDLRPVSFDEEESADLRRQFIRSGIRLTICFALIATGVWFAFWWSGSAVQFGAARAFDRAVPDWRVRGTVRDAVTHKPVPWARVEDDPAGQLPFFHSEADQFGAYELLTLSVPHRVLVSSPGYVTVTVEVGRVWFLWMPRGGERRPIDLQPSTHP